MTAQPLFTLDELRAAAEVVRAHVPPTPQHSWPLLQQRLGFEVVVKHENHTPTGAFKVRGGAVYLDGLERSGKMPAGLVTATRGNHGQSIARAAALHGVPCVIVVPEGNSAEKNAAMAAFGAELVVTGKDFDEARVTAERICSNRGYSFVPSFHRDLVLGVATYALELFTAHPDLAAVYVPIGMGSGICGLITARDLLGLKTEIVGVVSERAPAYALSYEAGRPVSTETAWTFADGMACREPQELPLRIIREGAARVIRVGDDEIAQAIRVYHSDTHNLAEGAGAAPLAGLMRERERYTVDQKTGVVLCGGNIDAPLFAEVLAGRTPDVKPKV